MDYKKFFCVKCDEYVDVQEKVTTISHQIKDEHITLEVLMPYCIACGCQLSDLDVEEKHFDIALNEYRRRKNLLKPEQIKEIRDFYGLSQRAFARALGFAEPTINRYEMGAVQDNIHNSILMLVKDPQNMLQISHQNRSNLSEKEIHMIKERSQTKSGQTIHIEESKTLIELKTTLEKVDKRLLKLENLDKKVTAILHHTREITQEANKNRLQELLRADEYPKKNTFNIKPELEFPLYDN